MKKPAVITKLELQPGKPATGLAHRSLGALKWNYLGAVVRMLSQLVIGIVLARQLGPEPFGLIAIASLIIGLGNLVADTGLGVALIQKEQVSPRDIRFVFTLQMLAGLTLALLAMVAAPSIAGFFGRADAVPVLRWMSLLFVFQAFGQTASALLRRDLNHKRLQIIQILSYLAGYLLVGMPLAFSGLGVWALVSAQLTQSAMNAIAVYLSTRHPLKPAFNADQSGLFKFGSKVLASNLTSWGISNLDSAIIGRMLGIVNLGVYNRSMNLIASPMNAVVSTLQGVLLPLYSRLQSRAEAVRDTYLASICVMSVVLAPAFAALAAMPETTILAVYGQEWRAAIVLITPLALAMPVNAVLAMGGPMMLGMGRAGMDAASQAIGLVVMVLAVIVASRYSLSAVAWVVLAVYLLRAWLVTHVAAGLIAAPARALLRALIGPLMLAVLAGLLAWQADYWLTFVLPQPGLRFVLVLASAAIIVLIAIALWGRWIFCSEAKGLMRSAQPHLGPRLGGLMMQWSAA
ncbi:MAG: lipopolysaccharide biosynthesis protein [Gammaproteobacteria bacterium]|nr:lipopolysaccharide biosynthesis protein [Gammaproteobacteria bacterium]MBU1481736.1 lipopolysaccharide biosynthesis protein [Gammaproteobacteria bacterium]